MREKYQQIINELGKGRVLINEPMTKHAHIKIGGPADLFFIAKTRDDLINSIQAAIRLKIPFTIIGWASNSLISDKGIRGLVIKNEYQEYEILEELGVPKDEKPAEKEDARQVEWEGALTYEFRDLDYIETGVPEVLARVSSGYSLPLFIKKMLNEKITGLQWFVRIPGTIGGAVFNNIHGGKKLFGPYVQKATLIDKKTGEIKEVDSAYFEFGYDKSKLHANKNILIDVTLKLKRGDVKKARWAAKEWEKRKSIQPWNSLGSTFANPPEEITRAQGYPTSSVGYFVEHVLGWKDKFRIGGAGMGRGYGHAGLIVNEKNATAQDYLKILNIVKKAYKEKTGYDLTPEIFFLGEFDGEIER